MAYKLNMTGDAFAEIFSQMHTTVNEHSNFFNNTLMFRGINPIATSDQDTCIVWQQIPSGIYWFNDAGKPLGISQYGYLIHITYAWKKEIQQIFICAPGGQQYFRGANNAGWAKANGLDTCGNDVWTRIAEVF